MQGIMVVALAVLFSMPGGVLAQDGKKVHAGIEVGGRGVKFTVLEVGEGGLLRRLQSRTVTTTLSVLDAKGAFKEEAMEATAKAIGEYYQSAKETYKIPDRRIHVVGSSGVPGAKNRASFVAAVKKATGKEIIFIDDKTEVALGFLGIVPKGERSESISLDIGGGNTKGGYVSEGKPLVYVAVPLGSVTFLQKVRQEASKSKESLASVAVRLREVELVKPLRDGARAMAELGTRKKVYLSGGMVWAMTSLVHPEAVDDAYVSFTAADIERFAKMVEKSGGRFPKVDLSVIKDPGSRSRAEDQLKAVGKVYDADNLVTGVEILRALAVAFDLKGKSMVFPRNGAFGWLTAYVAGEKVR